MSDLLFNALRRKESIARRSGNTELADRLAERIAAIENPAPFSKMNKADLMDAAVAAGVEVDESMTKKQILEALEN